MKCAISLLSLVLLSLISTAQLERKVLIIGIDGTRPDALQAANTPNLDAIRDNGYFSPDALNDDITISGPGWSAILTGVWSDKHLVTGNNFSGNNYAEYPSIFTLAEEIKPDLNTASFCHWSPINDNIIQGAADYSINLGTDALISSESINYLTNDDPDLIFLHFDDVDHAGHSFGFSPNVPEYITAIEEVDALVGPVMTALQNRTNYANENWLILVSTDHGGQGFSHGGTTLEHERVFLMASGDYITNEVVTRDSSLVSTGISNCLGDFEELRFDAGNDYVEIPNNPLFDFGTSQDFTVECRVRTGSPGDVGIVGNKDWDSGVFPGFIFSFEIGGPSWKVNIGDGSNRADLEIGGAIADNAWHTLSVTFDRDGNMDMYEDGAFLGSEDISLVGNINTGTGLFFGADNLGDYQFDGSIAEVRVWNEVLSAIEIADYSCQTVDGTHPSSGNLIGHWKMNEGTGETAVPDYSGNGNNGTQVNTTWSNPADAYEYDFSSTPRLVDLPISALHHLCIQAKPEWGLEGLTRIVDCEYSPIIFDSSNGYISAETGISYSWYVDGVFVPGAIGIDFTPNQGGLVTSYIVNSDGMGAMSNGINWGVVGGVLGCTNPDATNYNPEASLDDGSCVGIVDNACIEDLNQDGVVSAADLLQLLSAFGTSCN